MNQLNIHGIASLYEAIPPAEACELEIHHSPKRGSWLNMAVIVLCVLIRQCLCRQVLHTRNSPESEPAIWQTARNAVATVIDWRFTTADARIKLKRLYPST